MAPRSTINKTSDGKKQVLLSSAMGIKPDVGSNSLGKNVAEVGDDHYNINQNDSDVDDNRLDADDTMFKPSSTKSLLRGASETSIRTRGANGISRKRKLPDEAIVEQPKKVSALKGKAATKKATKKTESKKIVSNTTDDDIQEIVVNEPAAKRKKIVDDTHTTSISQAPAKNANDNMLVVDVEKIKTKPKAAILSHQSQKILMSEDGGEVLTGNESTDDDGQNTNGSADGVLPSDGNTSEDMSLLKSRKKTLSKIILDTEAEESDGDSNVDVNEYDLEDGFIDDSGVAPDDTDEEDKDLKNELRKCDSDFVSELKESERKHGNNNKTDATRKDGRKLVGKVKRSVKEIGKGKGRLRQSPDWDETKFDADDEQKNNGVDSDDSAEVDQISHAINNSLIVNSRKKTDANGASSSKTGRRSFKDLIGNVPYLPIEPVTPASIKIRDPVNKYRVKILPSKCEVFNEMIQDPLLAEYYVGLPNLTLCVFMSWATARGPGAFQFSSWIERCPYMDADMCMDVINFVQFGRYLNPARANPTITTALKVTADGFRSNLMVDGEPAILISTMFSDKSHLLVPAQGPLKIKFISGIGHTQEWERQVSFIGMAFGHQILHAQLLSDALSYTTRTGNRSFGSTNGFSSHQSPSTGTQGGYQNSSVRDIALNALDRIPVYDARNTNFDASSDWANLAALLPPFTTEIPRGSFIAVGYTCNVYLASNDKWSLSANVQFVVVLGTASGDGIKN